MLEDSLRGIVVIMLDSLRPDFLGCIGDKVKTPNIDRVAYEGTFFENAYAEYPITVPSRTALVSGNYTFTNRPWCNLRSYDMHIAEVLKEHGVNTVGFADTPMREAGLDRGFKEFYGYVVGKCLSPVEDIKCDFKPGYFPEFLDGWDRGEKDIYSNTMKNRFYSIKKYGKTSLELVFDSAGEWLEKYDKKEPFFVWIDSFEPHEPWCPPEPYESMYQTKYTRYIPLPVGPSCEWMNVEDLEHVKNLYRGDITHTDEQIGNLLHILEKKNIIDDTLIVIISDHGEPFGEHGTIRKYNIPVYEELAKMVFIVRKPGIVLPKRISKALVGNIDLPITILDLLNIRVSKRKGERGYKEFSKYVIGEELDGKSLMKILKGEAEEIHEEFYCGAFGLHTSIRQGPWKFIENRGEKENELFNLNEDTKELKNLVDKERDIVKVLHRKLWEFNSRWACPLDWRDAPAGI